MHTPAALPPGKALFGVCWIGGLLDTRDGLDAAEKRDLILKPAGIQLHLLVFFVVGLSSYLFHSSTTAFPCRIVLINSHKWRTPSPTTPRKTLGTHCQVPAFAHSTASCVLIHYIGSEDTWNKCNAVIIIPTNELMQACAKFINFFCIHMRNMKKHQRVKADCAFCIFVPCTFFPSLSFPPSSFFVSFQYLILCVFLS
jgi:hypothetical protein